MKIKMLDENNLKIMFDYTELEENNISIHSFLSNSHQTQKFLEAILDIADEDFGFNTSGTEISYEAFSFNNIFFIVLVTKSNTLLNNENIFFYKFRDINDVLDFCDTLNSILPTLNFKSSLYQYNDLYFLKFDFKNLEDTLKNQIFWRISEFKNHISFTKLGLSKVLEFSTLLIKDSALTSL